ncbi:Protein of unknown function [Prosthecobacter debontii]|uniref:DUF3037 domain-containing protein n=1 Tax=Prosthecobacter debontii TaxID=48467 RepID=A0A1T4Y0V3_9BACT|nr:DUF3037 domain-containing protein [Prosthecobacter debontii]SKA94885.1 Protein of unknown function [Prosthecobacter debontii]
MKPHLCKYSIIRFLPYRETEEFVNIGVLVLCEELGYLGFLLEKKRSTRVTHFFNELDASIYRHGILALEQEIKRLNPKSTDIDGCLSLAGGAPNLSAAFQFLTRPRKTLFYFSEPRVLLDADPVAALKRLFADYVRRQFAQPKEYQEQLMREAISNSLKQWNLHRFYHALDVGTDIYRMKFPFVHQTHSRVERAIRVLNLNFNESTDILRRNDEVVGGLTRLRNAHVLPDDCMIVVKAPKSTTKTHEIAMDVCSNIQGLDVQTALYGDHTKLRNFAEKASNTASN